MPDAAAEVAFWDAALVFLSSGTYPVDELEPQGAIFIASVREALDGTLDRLRDSLSGDSAPDAARTDLLEMQREWQRLRDFVDAYPYG